MVGWPFARPGFSWILKVYICSQHIQSSNRWHRYVLGTTAGLYDRRALMSTLNRSEDINPLHHVQTESHRKHQRLCYGAIGHLCSCHSCPCPSTSLSLSPLVPLVRGFFPFERRVVGLTTLAARSASRSLGSRAVLLEPKHRHRITGQDRHRISTELIRRRGFFQV